MEIMQYVPKRDKLGRFVPSKSLIVKVGIILVTVTSLLANYYLLKVNYVVTCKYTIEGIRQENLGHLMNDRTCDKIVAYREDSLKLSRQEIINQ